LSPARQESLKGIPTWVWHADPFAERWERGYAALLRFVARTGHARVPSKHKEDGFSLGRWVNRQRVAHTYGKLASERITRLSRVKFVWDARDAEADGQSD
jgi:hypothetical protein